MSPHCPQHELNQVYEETLKALNADTKKFFSTYEQEKEKFEKEKQELNIERRAELKDLFQKRLEEKLKK